MRFKGLKNLTKDKLKPKGEEGAKGENKAEAASITEMEEHLNGRMRNLKEAARELRNLTGREASEEVPENIGPHGPKGELTLDTEDLGDESDISLDTVADTLLEDDEESIKVVDLNPAPAAATEKTEDDIKLDDKEDDSLSNLFSSEETEENPLASLISSLPDVTAQELIDDLNEIKSIIKDWQQS